MNDRGTEGSRGDPLPPELSRFKIQLIAAFWQVLDESGDAGGIHWEVLVPLRDEVTEALKENPPDILSAERLTAKAAAMMTRMDF